MPVPVEPGTEPVPPIGREAAVVESGAEEAEAVELIGL